MSQGSRYINIGNECFTNCDFKQAISNYEKALSIVTAEKDWVNIQICFGNIGSAYEHLGDPIKSIEYFEYALEIAMQIKNEKWVTKRYVDLCNVYEMAGNSKKAVEYSKMALQIATKNVDKATEIRCNIVLGNSYLKLADYCNAIDYHNDALKGALEIKDIQAESNCYTNLGNCHLYLGNYRVSKEFYEKGLKTSVNIGDRSGESKSYTALGNVLYKLGDYRKALEYCEAALIIANELNDYDSELACYGSIGMIYDSLNDYTNAERYYRSSLNISILHNDRFGEAQCYSNLGTVFGRAGESNEALKYFEKALAIASEIEDKSGESKNYTNLAETYRVLEIYDKAMENYEKALNIILTIGDKSGETIVTACIGMLYFELHNCSKAIEYYNKALGIAIELGELNAQRVIRFYLAHVNNFLGENDKAYLFCKDSIVIIENMRAQLIQDEQKISFFARAESAYHLMIDICLKLNKHAEAFEYLEKVKSRALLDLLSSICINHGDITDIKLKTILDKEELLLIRLREIQMQYLHKDKHPAKIGEVDDINLQLSGLAKEIENIWPEHAFTRKGISISIAEVNDLLANMQQGAILIEYYFIDNMLLIFVLSSRNDGIRVLNVQVDKNIILNYLENFEREVAKYAIYGDIGNTWLALSQYLIEPIKDLLIPGDLIYFVPFDLLHYLPLHALEKNGIPLICEHPVVYTHSASLLKYFPKMGSGKIESAISFGVDFENEAIEVAALFNGNAHITDVTVASVQQQCIKKDIIHFACHGRFDSLQPLKSGLQLSEEILDLPEICNMKLEAELVTLSACSTGLSNRNPGDELIGLTRAFLFSGAASVIVSLWPVYSPSTQELMLEFYSLLRKGIPKAKALQIAQNNMMKKEEYSHPYFWAPFLLIGSWE